MPAATTTIDKYIKDFKKAIEAIGREKLVGNIIESYAKRISDTIKTGNGISDADIAKLFHTLLIDKRLKPSPTTYKTGAPAGPTDYPLAWSTSKRSYNVDYDYWFTDQNNTKTSSLIYYMFEYLKTQSSNTSILSLVANFFGYKDDQTEKYEKLFDNLISIVKNDASANK